MYSFIKGTIESKQDSQLVIEANGIGYEITCSLSTMENIGNVGDSAKIFTFLNVREDEMSLYGFYNLIEKQMFLHLTSISGIGPKTAIGILSNVNMSDLAMAILSNDSTTLSKVKGIGKKTAERIILELKEKLSDFADITIVNKDIQSTETTDAITALVSLGIQQAEAVKMVRKLAVAGDKAEQIVSKVLKSM